jgi:hypothetical protein
MENFSNFLLLSGNWVDTAKLTNYYEVDMDIKDAAADFFRNVFDHHTMTGVGQDGETIFVYTKRRFYEDYDTTKYQGYPVKFVYVGVVRPANDD